MRRPDYFYEKTAEDLSISKELSKKVNKFFWNQGIKQSIREGTHAVMYVRHLGTFYVREWTIREEILKKIRLIKGVKKNQSYRTQDRIDRIVEMNMEQLKSMLKLKSEITNILSKVENRKKELDEQMD